MQPIYDKFLSCLKQMEILEFSYLFIIIGLCTVITHSILNLSKAGVFIAAIIGTVGAVIGVVLVRMLHVPELLTIDVAREPIPVIWSIMGSGMFAILFSIFLKGFKISRRKISHSETIRSYQTRTL